VTICDAVEAASRTLEKADPAAIDALVQRIVYGKLHLGQLGESARGTRRSVIARGCLRAPERTPSRARR